MTGVQQEVWTRRIESGYKSIDMPLCPQRMYGESDMLIRHLTCSFCYESVSGSRLDVMAAAIIELRRE